MNYFFSPPGRRDQPLELTYNRARRAVRDRHGLRPHRDRRRRHRRNPREAWPGKGIEPEKPPYTIREGGSRICFVRDPDGYRIELIEPATRAAPPPSGPRFTPDG